MNAKIAALRKHLGTAENIELVEYDERVFIPETSPGEYLVLSSNEAQEAVATYVEETLWAFRPGFLADWMPLDEKSIAKLQEACEDCNDALIALVGEDLGDLIAAAVSADGRGHFLSGYDGVETEIDNFYIYKVG